MAKSLVKGYQPNPLKKSTGDCVIRSFAKATGKDWDTVYKELCHIGFELKVMPNEKEAYETFLKENGFTYKGVSNKKGSKRPTVQSFTKENKKGTFVLVVANHLVTAHDGHYYDTWDSGEKSMYGWWEK